MVAKKKKKGSFSREKGKRGERDAAKWLRDNLGGEPRRGVQYSGGSDSPDVVFNSRLHIEVKYQERPNLDAALSQAKADARDGQIPVVMHRKNAKPWKFTVEAKHIKAFAEIINSYK